VTTPALIETAGWTGETASEIDPYPPEAVNVEEVAATPAVVVIFDPPDTTMGTLT
jgi:hypothetical protein